MYVCYMVGDHAVANRHRALVRSGEQLEACGSRLHSAAVQIKCTLQRFEYES